VLPDTATGIMDAWVLGSSSAPPEAMRMFRVLSRPRNPLDQQLFRALLADAVTYYKTGAMDEAMWQADAIKGARGLELGAAKDVFTGCYKILRAGCRAQMTPEALDTDLVDLKVPPAIRADIQAAVAECQETAGGTRMGRVLTSTAQSKRLVQLKWRVDVTMYTNKMLRVRKPSILLQFHFDDGSIKLVDCSVERFQDLRYNVARQLKEIRQIERSRWVEDPPPSCA
jgi:hypothetical protein